MGTKFIFLCAMFLSTQLGFCGWQLINKTVSPNKEYGIFKNEDAEGEPAYALLTIKGSLGKNPDILYKFDGDEDNVELSAKWNFDETRVAVLVSYEVKLNKVVLLSRDSRKFVENTFDSPDAVTVYNEQYEANINRDSISL